MNSIKPSRPPTSEPRFAHISLFQEPSAQTFSLPPLPKHVCLTLSGEGNLELWPGQCLWEERVEGALKFDLPGDPARPRSGPHKILPLLQDSDAGKEDSHIDWGRACSGQGRHSVPRNGNKFCGHTLARTPTHNSSTESNEWPLGVGPTTSPACPVSPSPNTRQVSLRKESQS